MKKILLLTFLLVGIAFLNTRLPAQETIDSAALEIPKNWTSGGGLGFDFAQLVLINPKVGSGSNRIGFGGLVNLFANYKKTKFAWDNSASIQLGAQRIGGKNSPFEKSIDIFRLTSRASFRPGEGKLYGAVEADMMTLLLPTYVGNVLKPEDENENPIAKFFSPVQILISPGVEYKANDHLSFLYSPVALKLIYVADDSIAALNVHGNEPGKNHFLQLGSNLKARYSNILLKERLNWTSTFDLYSNYLQKPENIDVFWTNDLGLTIVKNLSINLATQLFYDDDVNVQVDLDDDGILGEDAPDVNLPPDKQRRELRPGVNFTEALLIKYNLIF